MAKPLYLFFKGLILFSAALSACGASSSTPTVGLPDEIQVALPTDTPTTLPFQLLRPKINKKAKYPLIVFLHGAGERGIDNKRQMMNGGNGIARFANEKKIGVFLFAPQCPENDKWADVKWSAPAHTLKPNPTKSMAAVMHLIDSIVAVDPIDTNRIYVTGLSMGGFGTWDLAMRQPWKFAALLPVCGGGDENKAKSIAHIPAYLVHGAKDQLVIPARSRNMVAALKAEGASPIYKELENVGHDAWNYVYNNDIVLEWLFQQRKK